MSLISTIKLTEVGRIAPAVSLGSSLGFVACSPGWISCSASGRCRRTRPATRRSSEATCSSWGAQRSCVLVKCPSETFARAASTCRACNSTTPGVPRPSPGRWGAGLVSLLVAYPPLVCNAAGRGRDRRPLLDPDSDGGLAGGQVRRARAGGVPAGQVQGQGARSARGGNDRVRARAGLLARVVARVAHGFARCMHAAC